jgi:hypothetical protein
MDIIDTIPRFTFTAKGDAEAFCKRMREATYKYDVVTVNDILKDLNRTGKLVSEGFRYGYSRKEIKKLKIVKDGICWQVVFPSKPGKMVRDRHGYWTTENVLALEATHEKE